MPSLRILLVESSAQTAETVGLVCSKIDAELVTAGDAEQALRLFAGSQTDMVLLSHRLSGLRAPELTSILKHQTADVPVPVLVLGEKDDIALRFAAFDAGADDYLGLPIEPEDLESRLRLLARVVELRRKIERSQREIDRLVAVDEPTGAHGRRFIHGQLKLEWVRADRYGEALSLVLVELTGLRQTLRQDGAERAATILREIARRMQESLRRCDLIARSGYDRFMVLMPNTSTVGAYFAAEKIRNVLTNRLLEHSGVSFSVDLALGVSTYQDGNFASPEMLVRSVEEALRQAIEKGPASVVLFHPVPLV